MESKARQPRQHEIPFEVVDRQDRHTLVERYRRQLPHGLAQLPPGLDELVTEFATEGISEERVLVFLRQGVLELMEVYAMIIDGTFPPFVVAILAANLIMSGENNEAVYMMFYYSLMHELVLRDPKCLKEILNTSSTLEQVCARCVHMTFLVSAQSRSRFIEYLIEHLHVTYNNIPPRILKLTGLANIICALQNEQVPGREGLLLHSLKQPEEVLSEMMRTNATNADDGSKSSVECTSYSDATLGWWLKRNTTHLPGNYFRVVHKGRSLFLSSSGKETLKYLRIKDGDELVIGGVCRSDENSSNVPKKTSKSKPAAKKRHKKLKGATKKNRKLLQTATHALSDTQLAEQHKREHSHSMNPVLEELDPQLKDIRNQLNKLTIQNNPPKVRGHNTKRSDVSQPASTFPLADECRVRKAGKVAYPILVGEASNLYKTSTPPHGRLVIDLHGCSKEEALEKLDKSLPVWVDTAMRGSAPWVVCVDIICGGGSQILSGAVKGWIRANVRVANRPKGLV